ncbi:MAG: hypothetical protein JRJ00_15125, partial [Deltaproteobacteria bacterium]|nr:hypothetical protein [Deltaproteobacteria bacterium]
IYWDGVPPEAKAFDKENQLIFMTGPLAGIDGIAGSRWVVCGKSPTNSPEHFSWSNLGGSWGAQLKFAGYDGIVVQGKSETPVYLLIRNGAVELRDASSLWGKYSVQVRDLIKNELGKRVRVVSTGPAGDNLVSMATILADEDASGCGFGAVMGSKRLKAIAIQGKGSRATVSNPSKLRDLAKYLRDLNLDKRARFLGLPEWPLPGKIRRQICYGCISGCQRISYESVDGVEGKYFCQAADFYKQHALKYYGDQNEVPFYATRICDKYGIDTKAVDAIIKWLSKCYRGNILSDESTGIPISKLGSKEFIETLVKKIALREGFGDILAQGIYQAADYVGSEARKMITDYIYKAEQTVLYGPRMYVTHGLFYAMEPRQPIQLLHETMWPALKWINRLNKPEDGSYMSSDTIRNIGQRFWGSKSAADFSTYDGKALAAKMIQDREYAIECLILCNMLWPIIDIEQSDDHIGDPSLESKLFSAVTGRDLDEFDFYRIGERVFNIHRAILVREGHRGRKDDRLAEFNYSVPLEADALNPDCLVPGNDGEVISRKGCVVDREKFESMLGEYYQLRGWDNSTGLQTRTKLEELNLEDISSDLGKKGLVV